MVAMTLPARTSLELIACELEHDPKLVSAHTRMNYRGDLERFELWRCGRSLTRLLVEEYAAVMRAAGRAPASINRSLSAIRWWAKRLVEMAFAQPMDPEQREEVVLQAGRVAGVVNVKGVRLPKGRHLANGEVRALLTACMGEASVLGVRDTALIGLAWSIGARQAELAGLRVDDIALDPDEERGRVTIRHGKGDKARELDFYHGAYEAVADWMTLRGQAPGHVFCAMARGGHLLEQRPLSHEAMRLILEERAKQAKLSKPVTWHDFRRTFIGNLLDAKVDLATAQRLAGHSDPKTTAGYDRRSEEIARQAVELLRLPYSRRTLGI